MRNRMGRPRLLWTALLLLALLACSPPHRDYPVAKIRTLESLVELMDVQATVADPCFDLVDDLGEAKLTDAQWAKFEDMGTRLVAAATRVTRFSLGDDFDRWNGDLRSRAGELRAHAAERNRAGALAGIRAIRQSCRACHVKYK